MIKRKKIALLVPDGVGIKNYLYSEVFNSPDLSLQLLHNFDKDTLSQISSKLIFERESTLPKYSEGLREKFLRELIHLSRLKYNSKKANNPTILLSWKKNHTSFKLKIFYTCVEIASNFISKYDDILNLEKKYNKAIRKREFYKSISEILKKDTPDVLFCTHQRALKAPTIFAAASDLGIKTVTVIYSWDNIPKARLALKADSYLVWSEYMKNELQSFYPEIEAKSIAITGTPQFEFYLKEENSIEKSAFFNTYKLDSTKKLICFSGDDSITSPYDPEYLNDLATAISEAKLQNTYQIIFRRCPVDISERYNWVLHKFPDLIIEMPPLWNFNSKIWSAVYPTFDDVKLLVSLAYYADVVVNVGSTMAFDFGMFNKPCIFINYDVKKDKSWSVETIYNFQHFQSMPTKDAVYWFNSKSEIIGILEKATSNGKTNIEDWFKIVVSEPENASAKILNELI